MYFLIYCFWQIVLLFLEHSTNSIPNDCKYNEALVVDKRLFFKQLVFAPRVEHSVEVTSVCKLKVYVCIYIYIYIYIYILIYYIYHIYILTWNHETICIHVYHHNHFVALSR